MLDPKALGHTIRRHRLHKGVHLETVAIAIGLTSKQYIRIEQGLADLRLDHLNVICNLLDMSPARLLWEAEFLDPNQ